MKRSLLFLFAVCSSLFLQAQVSKTIQIVAGKLSSALSPNEMGVVTNLTVTGTIDARDFKTIRDNLPVISFLDLSGTRILAYSGTNGTDLELDNANYLADELPIDALRFKENLLMVALPQTATSIGKSAFEACLDLKAVTFPLTLQNIGKRAFENCPALQAVNLPASLTSIGSSAFEDCRSLTEVTLPSAITTIEYGTFENCNNLTSVSLPSKVIEIGESAFEDCRKLSTIAIPTSLEKIGRYAFENCRELITVSLPSSVQSIGNFAFKDCRKLTSINLPPSLYCLSERTFEDCYALTSLTIPTSLGEIEKEVFSGCKSLTSILIPSGKIEIDDAAFEGCSSEIKVDALNPWYSALDGALYDKAKTKLISCPTSKTGAFVVPAKIDTIAKAAFSGCGKLSSISIPASVAVIDGSPFDGCSALVTVDSGNKRYSAVDGVLFNKSQDTLFYCPDSKTGSYSIPSTVKVIAKKAFKNCTKLSEVLVPVSVVSVEEDAFSGSSALVTVAVGNTSYKAIDGILFNYSQTTLLHCPVAKSGSYVLSSTVQRIARGAFEDCEQLTTIVLPETLEFIEKSAFEDCYGLEALNIPSSVDTIADRAFEDCKKLQTISIPSSVKSIGNNVFQGCSGLSSIHSKPVKPVLLDGVFDVFYQVDKDECLVFVEPGSKRDYQMARQWKNFRIVDGSQTGNLAPTTKVLDLPETTTVDSVLVRWQGSDPESNVIKFSVYVSENGSKFMKWMSTTKTEAWFKGDLGNTYSFFSVGVDTYRNTESMKNKAEATIHMNKPENKDTIPPVSHVLALPAVIQSESVNVSWQGTDQEGSSLTFTIFVSVDGGAFTKWLTTSANQSTFTGSYGNTYGFYAIAEDASGNVEPQKTTAEATTKMEKPVTPDLNPPFSKVFSLPEETNENTVVVKWGGNDPEGSPLTFTIFVSVDGGSFNEWLTTTSTQAEFAGNYGNTYGFFSLAKDSSGNAEAQKTTSEATIRMVQKVIVPIAVISQKWHDVLICHNNDEKFITYQWYKNGQPLQGETKQFYQEINGLNGAYYVRVETVGGENGISNTLDIGDHTKSLKVYPNPSEEGKELSIEIAADDSILKSSVLNLSNVNGQLIMRKTGLSSKTTLNGLSRGVYMLEIVMDQRQLYVEKLIVK